MKTSSTSTVRRSALAALEVPSILGVPAVLVACAVNGVQAAAGLTLLVVVLCVGLFLASYEASRPALRQVMPTATLAALAAAGRILFAPIPDVKPVSAIAIVAGATLGRREGFMVGALAALVSNFFFGQGVWTPWQMYAWGLVGYLAGVLGERGLFQRRGALYVYGFLSALMYGVILNGWYVIGYVGLSARCGDGRFPGGHLGAVGRAHPTRRREVRFVAASPGLRLAPSGLLPTAP